MYPNLNAELARKGFPSLMGINKFNENVISKDGVSTSVEFPPPYGDYLIEHKQNIKDIAVGLNMFPSPNVDQ